MASRARIAVGLVVVLGASTPARAAPPETGTAAGAWLSEMKAVLAPALPRGTTRAHASVRPFLSVLGQGGGAVADFGLDHYFAHIPLRLSLELAPLALAIEADGPGSIGHLRAGAAFATDLVEIGASAGTRFQNYGGAGISIAGFLRLGALDGLRLTLSYGYVLKRNRYTGDVGIGLSNLLTSLQIPLGRRSALFGEAGVSADKWVFASLGLRHRLVGDGGAGSWFVTGSFGVAWVIDRPECPYPETGWCAESAWAAGPTLGLGVEHRF